MQSLHPNEKAAKNTESMKQIYLIITACICFWANTAYPASPKSGKNPNIKIREARDHYKFVASKDGMSLDRIEHYSEVTFHSLRVGGKAYAMAYFQR